MNPLYYCLFIFTISTMTFSCINADTFAFPVDDLMPDKNKLNGDGRKPVWVPGRCAENEILYPGDNANDWVCDCKPAYIYHPETGSCYMPFSQGPCEDGKYLILKKNKVIPECATNPCKKGEVKFNGRCYSYGESEACNLKLSEHLEIDATSLKPKCITTSKSPLLATAVEYMKGGITDRDGFSDEVKELPSGAKQMFKNAPICQKGSKRRIVRSCTENK